MRSKIRMILKQVFTYIKITLHDNITKVYWIRILIVSHKGLLLQFSQQAFSCASAGFRFWVPVVWNETHKGPWQEDADRYCECVSRIAFYTDRQMRRDMITASVALMTHCYNRKDTRHCVMWENMILSKRFSVFFESLSLIRFKFFKPPLTLNFIQLFTVHGLFCPTDSRCSQEFVHRGYVGTSSLL